MVWIITFVMGFVGLHHCIVGSVEVLSGMFSGGGPSWSTFLHFLGWTTFGNVVGGVALVAMVKYSHAKLSE